MTATLDDNLRVLTRPIAGRSTLPGRGTVLHPIGSRAEAVRLASVVSALAGAGVPQVVSRLVGADGEPEDVYDGTGVPRTEALVDIEPSRRAQRTALSLTEAERTLQAHTPALVMLAGDADVTLAFALAASKLGIPIARIGGGLRCGDFSLAGEINRVMTDRLADLIFTDSREANDALEVEGISGDRVRTVGSTAVDLLVLHEERARRAAAWRPYGVEAGSYVLATLHRARNIGDPERIVRITEALASLGRRTPVIFPVHPLTRRLMEDAGCIALLEAAAVHVTRPLPYLEFLSLQQSAGAIITDSGGVQDEASALGVPCFTLRRDTERSVTLSLGTNVLLGEDPEEIADVHVDGRRGSMGSIPFWDGRAGERVAATVAERLSLPLAS